MPELLTLGHGAATAERIAELLRVADVERVVDIRTAPGSRRHPHFARRELERWLPEHGIGYRWEKRLGGWRNPPPDSPDTAVGESAFVGYAAHMRTTDFRQAVESVLHDASRIVTTVLCSESAWTHCHRRFLADFVVLVNGWEVTHISHDGTLEPHVPNPAARPRVVEGTSDVIELVYDSGQEPLL